MFNLADLSQAVIAGQEARVKELTQAAIDSGVEPLTIINEGLIAADGFAPDAASAVELCRRLLS